MRIATFAGALALLTSNVLLAQSEDDYTLTIEEYAVDGVAGMTTYRFYIDMVNPDDFLSSIYGNEEDPFELTTTTGFYNDVAATGSSADGINPGFLLPPFDALFPGLGYDSWFTIGIESAPTGNQTSVSAVESLGQPWIGCFDATSALSGQNILINDITGGAWYVLNGTPNGIPDAENQRVLCMQLTTAGEISGIFNVQVFVNGIGENDVRPRFEFDGTGVFTHSPNVVITPGCTDATACNFDETANEDDGSCLFAEDGYDCDGVCLADTDEDGICDDFEVPGCDDATACNYDDEATDNDGSCTYPEAFYGCDGACINDADADGICDELEVNGCTDAEACNYLMEATEDDGSCTYAEAGYNCAGVCLNDADGDGICDEFEIVGCSDATACNYNAAATDDGECVFAVGNCDVCDGMGGVIDNDQDDDGICDADETSGCSDVAACNYNANVTEDDGSCVFATEICEVCLGGVPVLQDADGDGICDGDEVPGCTDATACNYEPSATEDDGSCSYSTEVYDCEGNCNNDVDGDGICDELEVEGCTDEMACNYDADATEDNGSCTLPEAGYDCDGNCLNDSDGDLVCDEFEIAGCTDVDACNYSMDATDEDGSCAYADEYYDCDGNCLNDADMDGVCDVFEVAGCNDSSACNYDMNATDNDGSCEYADEYYDCDGNCLNDADMDGICDELEMGGCTDMMACNYNMDATEDDGSCEYAEEFYDCDGMCLNDSDMDGVCDELEVVGCTDMMACNYDMDATDDDGSCEYADEFYDCEGNCVNDSDMDGICDELEIAGCTDMMACNYNEAATDDDGSCEFAEEYYDCEGNCLNDTDGDGVCDELEIEGCTDSDAWNYNPDATEDDGSCAYCDLTLVVDTVVHSTGNDGSIEVTVEGTIGGTLTFAWSGPDDFVSDAEDIDGLSAGMYSLVVTDENGCQAEVEVTVDVLDSVDEFVGINLTLFPNPTSGILIVESDAFEGTGFVRMTDLSGRVVLEQQVVSSSHRMVLDVSGLANGPYALTVTTQSGMATEQVLVSH